MKPHIRLAQIVTFLLLILLVIPLFGCGSGGSNDDSEKSGRIRLVHASPRTPPVDLEIDRDETDIKGISYGGVSDYIDVDQGTRLIRVRADGIVTPLIDEDKKISADTDQTLFLIQPLEDVEALIVRDDNEDDPESGEFRLRIGNLTNGDNAPSVDVYITTLGEPISSTIPAASRIGQRAFSRYLDIEAGTYEIRFTRANSTRVVYDSGPVDFQEGQIQTLILLDPYSTLGPLTARLITDRD